LFVVFVNARPHRAAAFDVLKYLKARTSAWKARPATPLGDVLPVAAIDG
jgi:hypothetical protein